MRADPRLLPPSISDVRAKALAAVFQRGAADFDFSRLVLEDAAAVPAEVLPFLVRELGVDDLVGPEWPEVNVRRAIADAWRINLRRGTISGIRYGLSTLGIRPEIVEWHRTTPQGEPGTFAIRIYATEHIWPDRPVLDARLIRAARRVIDATKRWSQTDDLSVGIGFSPALGLAAGAAGAVRVRAVVRPPGFRITAAHPVGAVAAAAAVVTSRAVMTAPRMRIGGAHRLAAGAGASIRQTVHLSMRAS